MRLQVLASKRTRAKITCYSASHTHSPKIPCATGPSYLAKTTRPMQNGISVTAVYTPPEQRNKGYATSCVASLTKKLLSERYSFCSLFADQSNPTSNSIYAKIGYVPLGDALEIDFAT